jgi:DHA1 family inner membrane transport protein
LAIGHGYGLDALPYVAALVALAALALTWIAARMDAPAAVVARDVRERV